MADGLDFKSIEKRMHAAVSDALQDWANTVESEAQSLTPTETGKLRSSATTAVSGDQAAIGFTADYAPEVHEAVGDFFDNGQAKFLETALMSTRGDALKVIADRLRRV